VILGIAVPAIGVTFGEYPAGAGAAPSAGIPFAGVRRRGTIGAGFPGIGGGGAVPMSVAVPGLVGALPSSAFGAGGGGGDVGLGLVVFALFVVAASG